MTRDDFIGQLEGYLDEYEGATPLPGAVRNVIRAQLPTTRQIGPIAGLMRNVNMTTSAPVRYGLVAAVAVAAVVLGAALLSVGPFVGEDQDTRIPSPSPILIEPTGTGSTNRLAAGRYYVDDPFPVRFSFELPADWLVGRYASGGSFLQLSGHFEPSGELTIQVVENMYTDPCNAGLFGPPVGPSVDDLVSALRNLPSVEVTAPDDVTVDGYAGKQLELTDAACEQLALWRSSAGRLNMGSDETFEVLILDVDGVRLVVAAGYSPQVSEEALAELHAVVDSIQIP